MSPATPHYLLFSESSHPSSTGIDGGSRCGQWRFVLESLNGTTKLEVSDEEDDMPDDRLELLAVVRGLEALPEPARVTLVTTSRYVSRGLRFGLAEWRENGWQWESFGQMSPIKNADLWQRLDRALRIHDVRYRTWRFDRAHGGPARPAAGSSRPAVRTRLRATGSEDAVGTTGTVRRGTIRRGLQRALEMVYGAVTATPWCAVTEVAK